ncbi:hypothetical protein, partial [Enterobacter roggenkampii]
REAIDEARNAMAQRAWGPQLDDAAHIAAAGVTPERARFLASLFATYRETAPAPVPDALAGPSIGGAPET